MKIKILILLSVLYLNCTTKNKTTGSSSATKTDSTTIWINSARNDLSLLKSKRIKLLDKANNSITNYPDNLAKAIALSNLSLSYSRLGDTISFRKKNTQLIKLSKKLGDSKSHGEAHWDLGYYFRHRQADSAIYHYKEAYSLFLKADLDSASLNYPGRILYGMALVKDNNKDHAGAEKDIVKAIRFFLENGIDERLFDSYNLLAVTQSGIGKFNKALEYHKKAKEFIPLSKKSNRYSQNTTNINNMASTNLRKGDYLQSIIFYEKLLDTDSLFYKKTKLYAKAISGLSYAQFKNGYPGFTHLIKELNASNKILDSIGVTYDKARNYEYKAEVLHKAGNTYLAIRNALLAKKIAQETTNNARLLSSLKLLTTLDRKNSAQYADNYFNLSEELQRQERLIQDKFARIELETDEAIEENVSLTKQRKTLIGIAIGLLCLGLGAFVIITQRANNRKLKFKQTQQESNQEIYSLMLSQQGKLQEGKQLEQKRISEEIHDGILGQMLGIRLILTGLNDHSDKASITQRAELIEKLRELEEEIRIISHELNEAAYKKINNYIMAIKGLVNTVSTSAKMRISFNFTEAFNWDNIEGNIKINTYRIAQECLQNCVKHAKCKNITVSLIHNETGILLRVVDDGIGFNVKKGKRGIGLKNIASRIKNINGDLKIKSTPGVGTEMIITVPLLQEEELKKENSYTQECVLEV